MVVRIDGRSFHRFVEAHQYTKPNDIRGLQLMNECAQQVLKSVPDCICAYGQSDEYSFILPPDSSLFSRRSSKLLSVIVSCFSSSFVFLWSQYFSDIPLQRDLIPVFDGRVVSYPTTKNIRDYLSWRQADCHINNLYNVCFWNLVQSAGMTGKAAEELLKGTVSSDKNELLFSRFGLNYNEMEAVYRKGTFIYISKNEEGKRHVIECSPDLISNQFWEEIASSFGGKWGAVLSKYT